MYSPELVRTLHDVDAFHKNLRLLFDDLVHCVKEKTYKETLQPLTGPENEYWFGGSNISEFRRIWIFKHQDRIRFVSMLVKTHESHLNDGNSAYSALCRQLNRDPRFPLLLACGVFRPHNQDRFSGDNYVRRDWALSACLLNLQNGHRIPSLTNIKLGDTLALQNTDESNPTWCGELTVSFHDLAAMTDSLKLSAMADRLLEM